MIKITNTKNLTGVTVSGDYYDLEKLVDAFHEITIDEYSEKHNEYYNISIRILGICYDIRHAMQGDREIELVKNGMDKEKMKWHSAITPDTNVYYKCNILYPEMILFMVSSNALIKLRINDKDKSTKLYSNALGKNVVWDETIAVIRNFQAQFVNCVKEILSENSFKRWLTYMNDSYSFIEDIASQYVDLISIEYIKMNKEKRLKKFNAVTKQIACYSQFEEHLEIKEVVHKCAEKNMCEEGSVRLKGIEYPENIVW